MELADQQATENEGLVGAEIPQGDARSSAAEGVAHSPKAADDKPLTLREQLVKNVETIRTEEAKRARAADGKFTKLESATEPAASPEVQKPEVNANPEASPAEGPPSAWKGIWDSMTPEARAIAVKRESEVAKGFEEYRGKTAQLQEISQALDPLRPVLQQHGITSDAAAVKSLLAWEGSFRNPQTRVQAFHDLAKQYGVDLSTLVPSSQSAAPSYAQDIPDPIRPVLDQYGQQISEVRSQVQSWQQQMQQQEQQQIAEKLSTFAKDKPHFEAVRATMGQLMSAGIVSMGDLEGAYQKAIAIHPEISAQIRAQEEKAKADEQARTRAEKAKQAALAAVSPSSRSPAGGGEPVHQGKGSVRDAILSSVRTLREEQRA